MKKLIRLTIMAAGVLITQNSFADLSINSSRAPAFSPNAHVGNVKICPHLAEKAGCTAMDTSQSCGVKIITQNEQGTFGSRTVH